MSANIGMAHPHDKSIHVEYFGPGRGDSELTTRTHVGQCHSAVAKLSRRSDFAWIAASEETRHGSQQEAARACQRVPGPISLGTGCRQAAANDRLANSLAFSRLTRTDSSSTSPDVRSVSGDRTGPESRPITFIPALIIDTA